MLVKLFIVTPIRFICTVRNWPWVWRFLNRRGRREWRMRVSQLNSIQQRIVDDLKRDGIAMTHIDELFPGENMLSKLQGYMQTIRPDASIWHTKTFLTKLWDRRALLDFNNPYLGFALDSRIIAIVNAYLEMFTKFYYFTLNVTTPVPEGSEERQSQRWHRDPEDRTTCKMFLYLNDVDEETGPFIYIPGSHPDGKWGKLFPRKWPKGVYPSKEEISRVIPASAIKRCTGKQGTIIFCDTTGIHKGGYALLRERFMFTSGFYSSASIRLIPFEHGKSVQEKFSFLDPAVQFALTPPPKKIISTAFFRFKKSFIASGYEED